MRLVLNLSNRVVRRSLGAIGLCGAVAAAYFVGGARADGIPTGDALFYSGVLEDNGVLVDDPRNVVVELYDSASGGTAQCVTSVAAVPFTAGRFRVPLSSTCVAAVHANANLYTQVSVGGTVLPRAKLGAVPYAIEAERAATSATADDSDLLDGADSSTFAQAAHTHEAAAITSGTLGAARGGVGISPLVGNGNRLVGFNAGSTGYEAKALSGTPTEVTVTQGVGSVTLGLAVGVPHNCTRHELSTTAESTTVNCPAGKVVVGGGGACAPSDDQGQATENRLKYTRPAFDRSGWLSVCTVTNGSKSTWSYAICCEE